MCAVPPGTPGTPPAEVDPPRTLTPVDIPSPPIPWYGSGGDGRQSFVEWSSLSFSTSLSGGIGRLLSSEGESWRRAATFMVVVYDELAVMNGELDGLVAVLDDELGGQRQAGKM